MTKKEIREVIDIYTDDGCLFPDKRCMSRCVAKGHEEYCLSDEESYKCLMERLKGIGVAIKVKGELPQVTEGARQDRKWVAAFVCGEMEMLKAGYTLTEDLV